MEHQIDYDLQSVKLPRMAGGLLKLFAGLLENSLTRGLLLGNLLKSGGITQFRQLEVNSPPTFLPIYPCSPDGMPYSEEPESPWNSSRIPR